MVIRNPPARTAPEWLIRATVRRGVGVDGRRDGYRLKDPISNMRSSACHINVPNATEPSQRVTHTVCRPLRAAASSAAVALARCLQRPRRLISRAPDLPLLALGRGTMAPFLCPETLRGGSSALPPVKPRCRSSFVRRPHGKLSACDSVSAPLSAPGRAADNSEDRRSPTGAGCALNCVSFTLRSLERG